MLQRLGSDLRRWKGPGGPPGLQIQCGVIFKLRVGSIPMHLRHFFIHHMEANQHIIPKVIGTLGHIDHGKTSLIRAMTGADPDRLPDEKRRGLTIDLGFAWMTLPDQGPVGIIDVPGHEAYIRNMLAGASGIDLGLLVIAADDGVMPQTREHVDILGLLNIPALVCALTKTDRVDADMLALAQSDIIDYLGTTPYADTPIIPVSSTTGEGMEALKTALDNALGKVASSRSGHAFRLPVDRSFSLLGIGCVVTGTVWSGHISTGKELTLLPGDKRIKARRIQVHGETVERAAPGQRTALNLAGIKATDIQRGHVLADPGAFQTWDFLNAELSLLSSAPKPIKSFQKVRIHIGTQEAFAFVVLPGNAKTLTPGQAAVCQLRFLSPVTAARGDRFIVRQESPLMTLGGGRVLLPTRTKIRPKHTEKFDALKALSTGGLAETVQLIYRWHGQRAPAPETLPPLLNVSSQVIADKVNSLVSQGKLINLGEGLILDPAAFDHLAQRILDAVKTLHERHPARPWLKTLDLRNELPAMDEHLLQALLNHLSEKRKINRERDTLCLPGHREALSPEETAIRKAIAKTHRDNPYKPDSVNVIADACRQPPARVSAQYRLLADSGEMVNIGGQLFFTPQALAEAAEAAQGLTRDLGAFAVKDFRDALKTSRKHAVPLLEYLDRQKVTVKKADNTREAKAP